MSILKNLISNDTCRIGMLHWHVVLVCCIGMLYWYVVLVCCMHAKTSTYNCQLVIAMSVHVCKRDGVRNKQN